MTGVTSGEILVADHEGVYVIKMLGDVRLNLCIPFDNFIGNLLQKDDFISLLFDFSESEGLDSTTLGLVAKLAVKVKEAKAIKPSLMVIEPGIERLLDVTGILDLCHVIHASSIEAVSVGIFSALPDAQGALDEERVRHKVLEAHQVLMTLNDDNKNKFQDLVKTLSQK